MVKRTEAVENNHFKNRKTIEIITLKIETFWRQWLQRPHQNLFCSSLPILTDYSLNSDQNKIETTYNYIQVTPYFASYKTHSC